MIIKTGKYMLNAIRSVFKQDPLQSLIEKGNLQTGNNNVIHLMRIHYHAITSGVCNIQIGNDNLLENSITLLSPKAKITIGSRVYIGPATQLNCFQEIEIGTDVMFSWGCTVIDTDTHSLKSEERKDDVKVWKTNPQLKDWSNVKSKKIKIGDKCWIGCNSIILKGVELGEGCIVGAGSVVTKSFEPYSVIGGNPAKLIAITT